MEKIDLQLIQDINTNFVLYDNSNRGYAPNAWASFEETQEIGSIIVTFKSTSDHLLEDRVITIKNEPTSFINSIVQFDFSLMQVQEDFRITIPYNIIDEFYSILPEGKWDVQFDVVHNTVDFQSISYSEYSFKQTEIYRDLLFLHIARNVGIYQPYYNNYMTARDKFRVQCLYFDANFKALKAQIEIGNTTFAGKTLKWLQDFQLTNPINLITETND